MQFTWIHTLVASSILSCFVAVATPSDEPPAFVDSSISEYRESHTPLEVIACATFLSSVYGPGGKSAEGMWNTVVVPQVEGGASWALDLL